MKGHVIIFAKSPRMGMSKARLAAGIGPVRAWQVKRTLDAFTCRVARGAAWRTVLAVTPQKDVTARFPAVWPSNLPRMAQGQGDLGARMAAALCDYSIGPVCIIGSDLPDLRARDLHDAFRALKRHDVVLGPATDGGYWLIGMAARTARRANLSNIRWSSAMTLADTLQQLPERARVAFLRELEDVDDVRSLKRAR